jgi:hypothetical protein
MHIRPSRSMSVFLLNKISKLETKSQNRVESASILVIHSESMENRRPICQQKSPSYFGLLPNGVMGRMIFMG